MKILPVRAESFHVDGQMTKLIVASGNFANMPIKIKYPQ